MTFKLAVIGLGHMGGAILQSVLSSGYISKEEICVYDKDEQKARQWGTAAAISAREAVLDSEYILLAIRPQDLEEARWALYGAFENKTLISVLAGVTLERLERVLGCKCAVRVMPNTAIAAGKGAACLCFSSDVAEKDRDFALGIFRTGGCAYTVEEKDMNTAVALVGSSPAYTYMYIRALCTGAKEMGFDVSDEALKDLVCSAVSGAVELYRTGDRSTDQLIKAVKSPGGTTERAAAVLEDRGFEGAIIEAMEACGKRAKELSGE